MGDGTAIEWTDATWNPLVGCSRVSPGCDHCYAIGVVHRQMSPQHVGLTVKPADGPTDWTGEVREVPHLLDQPLRWKRPRRIFVNSLSDLFHPDVDALFIAKVFAVMALAPHHTFQVLTKRPKAMAGVLSDEHGEFRYKLGLERRALLSANPRLPDVGISWPLPNVWLGTSIESDRYSFRGDHLRATPAAVRWISAEPLLGPLTSLDMTGIDWVVVGGESGPGARPMHPDWVRDLRDRSANFLFKQWGGWGPAGDWRGPDHHVDFAGRLYQPGERAPDVIDRHEVAAIHRWGKKAAGRRLDGRTWDGYPDV